VIYQDIARNEKVPNYKQTWKKKEDEGKERSSLVEIFLLFNVDGNFYLRR
jgi:hypothetical protein